MTNRIKTLYGAVIERRHADPQSSRTARLLSLGRKKIAQKLGEEATEVVIEAIKGNRKGVIAESADLLYHLVVLWSDLGITPADIWAELDRRAAQTGIAEKLPKRGLEPAGACPRSAEEAPAVTAAPTTDAAAPG